MTRILSSIEICFWRMVIPLIADGSPIRAISSKIAALMQKYPFLRLLLKAAVILVIGYLVGLTASLFQNRLH